MFFSLILNILLSFLSYFVSKNKNQILMGSRDGKFVDNTKYFFLYLMTQESSLVFHWITKNKKLYKKFKDLDYPVVYLYSLQGFKTILKSNFLLLNQLVDDVSFSPILLGKFNLINLWHGTPFKRITIHDIKNQHSLKHTLKKIVKYFYKQSFFCILSSSNITSERFKQAVNSKLFPILGYPRNDVFFNKKLIFEDYSTLLQLTKYSKVFLYCPTLRDNTTKKPFSEQFLSKLNQFLIEKNSIFLIKWHTYEKHQYPMKKFSRIKDISEKINDIQELLPFIDILITDYSSVSYDFSLLEKPIIFYSYDYEDYIKSRNIYGQYFDEFPGPFIKNENDLLTEFTKIESIFNSKKNLERYQKFKAKFNQFQDGNSCQRLLDFLVSTAHNQKTS